MQIKQSMTRWYKDWLITSFERKLSHVKDGYLLKNSMAFFDTIEKAKWDILFKLFYHTFPVSYTYSIILNPKLVIRNPRHREGMYSVNPYFPSLRGKVWSHLPSLRGKVWSHLPSLRGKVWSYLPSKRGRVWSYLPSKRGRVWAYLPSKRGRVWAYLPSKRGRI